MILPRALPQRQISSNAPVHIYEMGSKFSTRTRNVRRADSDLRALFAGIVFLLEKQRKWVLVDAEQPPRIA